MHGGLTALGRVPWGVGARAGCACSGGAHDAQLPSPGLLQGDRGPPTPDFSPSSTEGSSWLRLSLKAALPGQIQFPESWRVAPGWPLVTTWAREAPLAAWGQVLCWPC